MHFQAGDNIGDYKIISFLGNGAFGEVYLAEWNTRKGVKQGALKVLKKQPGVALEDEFGAILDEVTTCGRCGWWGSGRGRRRIRVRNRGNDEGDDEPKITH